MGVLSELHQTINILFEVSPAHQTSTPSAISRCDFSRCSKLYTYEAIISSSALVCSMNCSRSVLAYSLPQLVGHPAPDVSFLSGFFLLSSGCLTYIYINYIRHLMKSKLTLRLEESLIKRAKERARQKGTSVSQMVAEYFSLLESKSTTSQNKLPPVTASFVGILKNTDVTEEDYKTYLEDKHLK
ncbi:DUF6364 family protein [Rhodohalobacter sp.]|uniref:DUF6364 family protein n=1 Tax=Rhodohalobacter sp. TaxID=1974210 RepID=UPI002ACD8CC7|nr:DUF6364 family protein [Rhodohalobacter sp.]MDZ7757270.1 DUF6364 family protein [Rhodohalobacter sp.]